MRSMSEELFENFKKSLESVNGTCLRSPKSELGKRIAEIFVNEKIGSTSLVDTDNLLKEGNVVGELESAGITVHLDHIRLYAEKDLGGVSVAQHGIAELGTIVQESDEVDGRLVSTMSECYIGVIKGSTIVATYDDMFDILSSMEVLPHYVGFVTGPSRTADIECVSTIGVHGPIKVYIVVVEDE